MKVANYLLILIFLLCVAVQYNDPDPVRWMVIYGAAAFCCIFFTFRKLPVYIPMATAIAAILWILLLLPEAWGKSASVRDIFSTVHMISPEVEVVREIGGLLIVASWMLVLAIKTRSFIRASIR